LAAIKESPADDSGRTRRRRLRRTERIASVDSLIRRANQSSRATGLSLDEAAAVVVDDLERAATTLNARVAPLVPGCGFLVAVAGLLFKAEPSTHGLAEVFSGLSVILAVGGIWFLTNGLVTYAGPRVVGLIPTIDDIAFAHDRLVRKHDSADRGSWMAGISLTCLILGILFGVHIQIGPR
jgi:hypothetical protein